MFSWCKLPLFVWSGINYVINKFFIETDNKDPKEYGLKVSVVKDGCSGNSYTMDIGSIAEAKENGDKLTSIEVHDMICHIADAVLAGGIRRAALISLFSADDQEMISAKTGNWWEKNPQRGRANNSVVLLRHKIDREYANG